MHYLNRHQIRAAINQLASADRPFLFLIDFKGEKGLVAELSQLATLGISCTLAGEELGKKILPAPHRPIRIEPHPIPFDLYQKGFNTVMRGIRHGDSYLLNLTYPTRLTGDLHLPEIYARASARYKFLLEDSFLFYSPEPFLQIQNGRVSSRPMKGTISAREANAREKLLNNPKELYEHYTIVDLIRNDLSMISTEVTVESFRYVESIGTQNGDILQTSTRITGKLPDNWQEQFGDLLLTVLPAGSISGAPKEKSVQLIEQAETSPRGFYTGVLGIYREATVDSCVIIRYIERDAGGSYQYRSGGGITSLSDAETEYRELLTKIYVPTH